MDKFLKRTFQTRNNDQENIPSKSNVAMKQKNCQKAIQERLDLVWIFWCGNKDAPKPPCVIGGEQLANEAMVPSNIMRHLNTKHAVHARKNKNYFQLMLS